MGLSADMYMCLECGACVLADITELHDEWHDKLTKDLRTLYNRNHSLRLLR